MTYPFNVTVNGDLNIESNETFFVNVTNVSGATVGDAQGLGTIQNDDNPTLTINDAQPAKATGEQRSSPSPLARRYLLPPAE